MISYKTIKQLNSTAKCLGVTVRVKDVHSYVMLKKRLLCCEIQAVQSWS